MEIAWQKYGFLVLVLFCLAEIGSGLECYACERQDSNKDKCVKTTKQCEEHMDVCSTTIRWGLPPYWTPYGERWHYIWKGCDTRSACMERQRQMAPHCKRDWYDDWSCIECCSGDMCNYYVTLAGDSILPSRVVILVSTFVALLAAKLVR